MNVLTSLKRCSLGLDLYLWLTCRTFTLRAPLRLSWRQLYRQFGPDPNNVATHDAVQNFRRRILRELKKIKTAWPELNLHDRSGRVGPLALDTDHHATQSRPASELISPFPASQWPVSGLLAPSWTLDIPPPPETLEAVNLLFPQACVILRSFPRANRTLFSPQIRANRTLFSPQVRANRTPMTSSKEQVVKNK